MNVNRLIQHFMYIKRVTEDICGQTLNAYSLRQNSISFCVERITFPVTHSERTILVSQNVAR